MLDLARLERVNLHRTPWGQILVAQLLRLDYRLPRRTEIVLEGAEHLERGHSYILAMNHTDRYNYWPFQYQLYRQRLGFTATRFREAVGRVPSDEEYRALRDLADGGVAEASLGRAVGDVKAFLEDFAQVFDRMIDQVMRLNRQALEFGQHLLVFPLRLSRGHIGVAQVAQHLGVDVVPVGCNGSNLVYPGSSPFARGGRIVYRVGKPLRLDGSELREYRVTEPFRPFTLDAGVHRKAFEGMTAVVMDHINELLDPEYQYADDQASDGVRGMDRFVST
jgi:1-acyl-sn-glycerol-3-phosphate acyltransferase